MHYFFGVLRSEPVHIETSNAACAQPAITCLKLTIEIPEQGVKCVQS